jgi:hypothetical protein
MTRALILLAITALACREKDPPKPATPGSAALAQPHVAVQPPAAAGEAPELPMFGSGGGGSASLVDRFAAEEIDASWKSHTEASLRARYAKMQHPPAETECRSDMCRLTITGTEQDIAASVDELQSLHDTAQSLMLTRPEPTKIVAYLQFDR